MGHKSGPEAPVCPMCHGHAGQVRGSLHHHARKQARWLAQGLGCPQPGKGGRDGGRARGQEEHAHCRSVGLQQECVPSKTGQRAISDKTVLTKHTEHGIHARGQDGLTPHALFEPQTLVMAPGLMAVQMDSALRMPGGAVWRMPRRAAALGRLFSWMMRFPVAEMKATTGTLGKERERMPSWRKRESVREGLDATIRSAAALPGASGASPATER